MVMELLEDKALTYKRVRYTLVPEAPLIERRFFMPLRP